MTLKSFLQVIAVSLFGVLASCSTTTPPSPPIPPVSECGKSSFVQKTKVLQKETCTAIDVTKLHPERKSIWGKKSQFWAPGTTLRVKFLEGSDKQKELTWQRFQTIQGICNIKFVQVTEGTSDIRVGFDKNDGHWSYVGIYNQRIPQAEKTLNIGLNALDGSQEWDRVGLHEILHAMGFLHELQHPFAEIPWDREAVYAYYAQTQGWSKAQVDAQVLNKATPDDFIGSGFDPDSIMCYPVSGAHTKNRLIVGWNYYFSPCDIKVIKEIYHF